MRYYFEWDPAKGNVNIQKHKVSFQRAAEVFKDPHAISIFDEEHSQEEDRWITMGSDYNGRILVVSHTFRRIDEDSFRIRIISSKKATKNERKQYEE
ncbi:MAG: BrnT family toxin [Desulfobacteraceae bacterium]|nr:BrnT family toxin [Desulfobacteraceae bacterium]